MTHNFMATLVLPLISLCSAVALAVSSARADDWPQWMGPERNSKSRETGLLKELPAGGPKLLWKATGIGNGYSTVAVVKDRIYTTGDRPDSSFIFALHGTEGKQVWTAKLGKPGAPGWGNFAGPRATPTVDGELLFTVGQYGELVCVETSKGEEKWRKDYSKDFGSSRPDWGWSESPLVDGDQVVVTPGGSKGAIVALDKKSGAVLWQTKDFADPAHYSSLIKVEIGGVAQYIQLTANHVVGIAAKDGKVLWRAVRKGETAVIPTPIYDNGYVYVSSGYNAGCNLFKISEQNGIFSAQQVYANKVMENHHGGVIKVGDYVYGYSESGGWTCQDFKTGQAKWQGKKLGKGSLVYADERLYLREEEGAGTVALIEASPEGCKEHGRFAQPERSKKNSWPHPVVSGGRLFLRDQDVLLCYDVKAR